MHWRRIVAWTLGIVALVAAAGAVALHVLVDPDRIKSMALAHARDHWQRELRIEDVSLSLFPSPAFRAIKVSFSNPPWCEDPHFLQADSVRADLELLALLRGELRVTSLALDGVSARLEEDGEGRSSWEIGGDAKGGGDSRLAVDEIVLRNVDIRHRAGGRAGEPWHVEEARIQASPGHRDVRIDARVARHGEPLAIEARLADLSKAGRPGAVTQGRISLRWKGTHAVAEGALPLHRSLAGGELGAHVKSASLQDVFAFFGIARGPTAPAELRFRARDAGGGRMEVSALEATLGGLAISGDARMAFAKGKPVVDARLRAGRLDWLETLVDAGGVVKPKRQNEEIFHEDRVAWGAVEALGAMDGSSVELRVDSLRLGNGLELRNVASRLELGGGGLSLGPFKAALLGGSAHGSLRLDAGKKSIHAKIEGEKLLLEQWFRQRGSKVPFSGGPMAVDANIRLAGATYRDLAASLDGTVRLSMGPGTWSSKRAGEYEEWMVSALAAKDSEEIAFECAAADLDFKAGRAKGERLLGARSNVSQLVAGGVVDFREEKIDLRGAVRAASGPSVGLAMFAGDVQIHGRLARPKVRLDPDSKPAIVARAAAAIVTGGATLLGGALVDAAESGKDPCRGVLR